MSGCWREQLMVMFQCDLAVVPFVMLCLYRNKVSMENALIEIASEYGHKNDVWYRKDGKFAMTDEATILCRAFALILNDQWFDEHDCVHSMRLNDLAKSTRSSLDELLSKSEFTPVMVIRLFNSMKQWIGIKKINTYKSMKF